MIEYLSEHQMWNYCQTTRLEVIYSINWLQTIFLLDHLITSSSPKQSISVTVLEPDSWPNAKDLKIDDSQFEALQLALTKEFAIIQGPPGTGKTYIGLKVCNKKRNKDIKVATDNWLIAHTTKIKPIHI